jgi:hypothetical protein
VSMKGGLRLEARRNVLWDQEIGVTIMMMREGSVLNARTKSRNGLMNLVDRYKA